VVADDLVPLDDYPRCYEAVRRVEEWLRREFAYTLDLPATPREATLDHFLFERRAGHCEYFSTAMAVLLRAAEIPARNVNGFLGGEWNASGGYLAVTQNDAHSWVEVWFPGLGWVPFDPTPSGSRNEVVGAQGGGSLVWPVLFWWDGLQHRWTKWVLFYDLDKQVTIARRLTGFFSGGGVRSPGAASTTLLRRIAPWAIGIAAFAAILLILLRRGPAGRRASAETRLYRDLRSAYTRAGYGSEGIPPLELAELVRVREAPAYEAGERAIHTYLRARFGGDELDADEAAQLRFDVQQVKRELRRRKSDFENGWSYAAKPAP
jgi:protein-glutamine gamma-glutamyltransferase